MTPTPVPTIAPLYPPIDLEAYMPASDIWGTFQTVWATLGWPLSIIVGVFIGMFVLAFVADGFKMIGGRSFETGAGKVSFTRSELLDIERARIKSGLVRNGIGFTGSADVSGDAQYGVSASIPAVGWDGGNDEDEGWDGS